MDRIGIAVVAQRAGNRLHGERDEGLPGRAVAAPTTAGDLAGVSRIRTSTSGRSTTPTSASIRRTRTASTRLSGDLYCPRTAAGPSHASATTSTATIRRLWIDPTNPNRMLSGDDGGFQIVRRREDVRRPQQRSPSRSSTTSTTTCSSRTRLRRPAGQRHVVRAEHVALARRHPQERLGDAGGGDGFFAVPDPTRP